MGATRAHEHPDLQQFADALGHPTPRAELESMLSDIVFATTRDERGVTLEVESTLSVGSALAMAGDLVDRVLRGEQQSERIR